MAGPDSATAARSVLDAAWVDPPGFAKPNPSKYPWQWLWDSCFHATIWSGLGDPRALTELETLFAMELKSGFIPHMGYARDPRASRLLWRYRGRSDITQPPMYGHALRVLATRGYDVSNLVEPATRGLDFLLRTRRDPGTGLIRIVHPWESGCDDSNRWDSWAGPVFRRQSWHLRKLHFVKSLLMRRGVPVANPAFDVGSVGFTALVAFNCREVARLTGDARLAGEADRLAAALERRWDPGLRTWVDVDAIRGKPRASSSVRTLDALLPLLVVSDRAQVDAAMAALFDKDHFWTRFGPAGTDITEPSFDPDTYWRGPAWPQLTYLLMIAAAEQGRPRDALRLSGALERGATASGHAEYWNPLTGGGLGAIPQSWTGLAHEATLLRRRLTPTPPQPPSPAAGATPLGV